MKPIKLIMSAFGPYIDEIEIDFTKFDGNGIFLITGDTGSGKTTIFDAICFALYGVASGSNRGKNSFRSDFAIDDCKTFVKLEFIHKNVLYKIERSPSYMRKKLRGEGMRQVSGDASISYLDKVITGDANVTEECVRILGLNASQFKQISMIAQGEFLKLLLAKSSDRALIFRKIFDTYIYKNISDILKNYYLEKKREYEDIGINISSLKDNLIIDDTYNIEDISTRELLDIISKQNKEDENVVIELDKNKNKLNKDIQKIVSDIDKANIINDNISKYDKVELSLKKMNDELSDINKKRELIIKNDSIQKKIIPVYREYKRIKDDIRDKEEDVKKRKVILKEIEGSFKIISDKYSNISNIQEDINKKKVELSKLEEYLSILEEINNLKKLFDEKENIYNLLMIDNYNRILDKFEESRMIGNRYKNEIDIFNEYKDQYNNMSENYIKDYNKFINCQAGIIASSLKDNEPCPVCGSTNHPKLAVLEDDNINKNDLDKEQKLLKELQDKLDLVSSNVSSLNKELEFVLKELSDYDEEEIENNVKLCQKNVNKIIDVSKYNLEDINDEISYLKAQIDVKTKLLKDIDEKEFDIKIKSIKEYIDSKEKDIKDITSKYESIKEEKIKCQSTIDTLEKDIKLLSKDIIKKEQLYVDSYNSFGYSSEEDYLKVMLSDDEVSSYVKEVEEYDKLLVELKKEKEVLKDVIRDKKKVNVDDLLSKKDKLNKQLNDIELSLKKINNKLNNNIIIYGKLEKVLDLIKKAEEELSIYEDLSNTANGSIRGKNKLEFEQYVQASYFDKVVMSANKRFSYMTDSRYLLLRKKESNRISDKLGLELEVLDNYTGKKREITSLSGGESFKASLSLALGISDVIQEYAGGIQIDVMFVDEGFGSLDSSSLEMAISAILKLSDNNKLVGIISHVNELKDRIDKKIVVKKTNNGSALSVVV